MTSSRLSPSKACIILHIRFSEALVRRLHASWDPVVPGLHWQAVRFAPVSTPMYRCVLNGHNVHFVCASRSWYISPRSSAIEVGRDTKEEGVGAEPRLMFTGAVKPEGAYHSLYMLIDRAS